MQDDLDQDFSGPRLIKILAESHIICMFLLHLKEPVYYFFFFEKLCRKWNTDSTYKNVVHRKTCKFCQN